MDIGRDYLLYFECLSAIIAILCYNKYYLYPFYKYFVLYVWIIVFFEVGGKLIETNTIGWYNIYTFFEYNSIAFLCFKLTKEKTSHLSIKYLILIFNVVYFTSFFILNLQSYTVVLGAIMVSFFMILYLKELLNSSEIINYKRDITFWITVTLLFYYLTTIPFYTVFYIIKIKSEYKIEAKLLFDLQITIAIFTHICFILGVLWSRKKVK